MKMNPTDKYIRQGRAVSPLPGHYQETVQQKLQTASIGDLEDGNGRAMTPVGRTTSFPPISTQYGQHPTSQVSTGLNKEPVKSGSVGSKAHGNKRCFYTMAGVGVVLALAVVVVLPVLLILKRKSYFL